jgi:hypothetical protein
VAKHPVNVHTVNSLLTKLTRHLPKEPRGSKAVDTSWIFDQTPDPNFRWRETYCSITGAGVQFIRRRMETAR